MSFLFDTSPFSLGLSFPFIVAWLAFTLALAAATVV